MISHWDHVFRRYWLLAVFYLRIRQILVANRTVGLAYNDITNGGLISSASEVKTDLLAASESNRPALLKP